MDKYTAVLTFSHSVRIEMIRKLLVSFICLVTYKTLMLPLDPPSPVYLSLVLLDIANCCHLCLLDGQFGLLLNILLHSLGGILGLLVSRRGFLPS